MPKLAQCFINPEISLINCLFNLGLFVLGHIRYQDHYIALIELNQFHPIITTAFDVFLSYNTHQQEAQIILLFCVLLRNTVTWVEACLCVLLL